MLALLFIVLANLAWSNAVSGHEQCTQSATNYYKRLVLQLSMPHKAQRRPGRGFSREPNEAYLNLHSPPWLSSLPTGSDGACGMWQWYSMPP